MPLRHIARTLFLTPAFSKQPVDDLALGWVHELQRYTRILQNGNCCDCYPQSGAKRHVEGGVLGAAVGVAVALAAALGNETPRRRWGLCPLLHANCTFTAQVTGAGPGARRPCVSAIGPGGLVIGRLRSAGSIMALPKAGLGSDSEFEDLVRVRPPYLTKQPN
jgi:hypothetical protein